MAGARRESTSRIDHDERFQRDNRTWRRLRRCIIPVRGDNHFEGDCLGTGKWIEGENTSLDNECLNRTQQVEAGRFAYLLYRRGAALRAP